MSWLTAAMLLGSQQAGTAVNGPDQAVRVVVFINSNCAWVTRSVIAQARDEASRLFLAEGIRLEWRSGKPPKDAAEFPFAAEVVAISFQMSPPTQYEAPDKVTALAVAQPYGKAPLPITVFGDRVVHFLAPFRGNDSGKVLGHILAHEIGHVLQGIARHSDSGLMKAQWTSRDLNEIRGAGLGFAAQDRQLLRIRFAPSQAAL